MNPASEKISHIAANESDQARPNSPTSESTTSPETTDDASLNENIDRRLYRRSVAYFLFGFGCNQHSIITDEP